MKTGARIVLFLVCLGVIAGCSRGIKKEPSIFPDPIVRTDKISGIWVLDDRKIEDFLCLSEHREGSYLIDFRPEVGKAYIKFLYDPKLYEADVETLGKYHYRLVKGNKSREFKLSEFYDRIAYWHFEDSEAYNPKDGGSVRDGTREPDYKDLKDGIEKVRYAFETPTCVQDSLINESE